MALSVALFGCGDGGDAQGVDVDARPYCDTPDLLWEDIVLDAFEPIPALESLDPTTLTPASPVDYWELRALPGLKSDRMDGSDVILSDGSKCTGASDPEACERQLDELSLAFPQTGFGYGVVTGACYGISCMYYIAVNQGDDSEAIGSSEELIAFLGTIDTPAEAALVALAHGYYWYQWDLSMSGIRAVEGGFELLAAFLVSGCDPVVHDRVHLFVPTEGGLEVRRQQLYESCGGCF